MNNTINSELASVYREWLEAVKQSNGIFCDKSGVEKFSNPYFFGVSDEWNIDAVKRKEPNSFESDSISKHKSFKCYFSR